MKKVLLVSVLCLSGKVALAAGNSEWQGNGKIYDINRKELGTYTLDVKSEPGTDAGEEVTVVKVVGSDFSKTMTCTTNEKDNSWSKTCDDGGSGGGYMFDYGLGQDYYRAANGHAYATQIIFDAKDKMRMERTELDEKGNAVHFFAEELTKVGE